MKTVNIPDTPREGISGCAAATVPPRRVRRTALFAPDMVSPRFKQAFVMLRPDIQWENPVMFVVEVGAFLTLLFVIQAAWREHPPARCRLPTSSHWTCGCS